jgi:hypothetical protein
MNEHLNPIFEILLPAIENANYQYWVFGGVAIAGIKGRFIRDNEDVDIFVLDENYLPTRDIVTSLAEDLSWEWKDGEEVRGRPKRDFKPPGSSKSIFSVMPAYKEGSRVKLIFPASADKYFLESELGRQKRNIGHHTFFTPSQAVIRDLFTHNLLYLIKHKKILTDESRIDLRKKYIKLMLQ